MVTVQDGDGKGQGSDESLYKIMFIHKPKYVKYMFTPYYSDGELARRNLGKNQGRINGQLLHALIEITRLIRFINQRRFDK
jgi:hypothetical protein